MKKSFLINYYTDKLKFKRKTKIVFKDEFLLKCYSKDKLKYYQISFLDSIEKVYNKNKNVPFLTKKLKRYRKSLSKKLNLTFIDIDNLIENEMGMTISDIFEKKGEVYFRNIEEKITLKTLKNSSNVISLGGGGFINDKIRKKILDNHLSFWLNWDESILVKRIKDSKKRPLAFKSTYQEIRQLIKKRDKIENN